MTQRLGAWRSRYVAAAADHPRHLVLLALCAGFATALLPMAVAVALALILIAAARAVPLMPSHSGALALGVVVVLAAVAGHLRVASLERSTLVQSQASMISGDATLLTAPRQDAYGHWRAVVRWEHERVLLRFPPWEHRAVGGIGDIVRVRGTLRPPDRVAGAMDARATLLARAVAATGRHRGGVLGVVDDVRRHAQRAFARAVPATEAALLSGMVLGQDEALPPETRDAFTASGLSHLTAASGQNVMLLVALALGVSVVLGLGFRARRVVVLGLVALYVPLAGAGAPIERAGVAGVAMVIATMAGRPVARWYAVLLSLAVTLAVDPRNVMAVGWQLSFAAVVGIALLAAPMSAWLRARRLPAALAEAVAVTTAATTATAPILAARFGQVSLVAVPANVLAAPAVPPVMWLGMIAAAVAQVSAAGAATVAALAALPLGFLLWLAHAAAAVPDAQAVAGPGLAVCAALALASVAALHRRADQLGEGRAASRMLVVAALAAGVVAVLLHAGRRSVLPPLTADELRVTALDVGQGDATLLQVPGHAVLVDAGPPGAPIVDELRRAGVGRLDALVVSHPQADHEGGAPAVLAQLPVQLLLDGRGHDRSTSSLALEPGLARRRTQIVPAEAGQELRAGALSLQVLWPPAGRGTADADPNDRAVVALASAFGSRALLTADAESPILSPLDVEPVDVLKVSHHGSDDPGLPALLDRLRPHVALIEVGPHNSYGHPARTTLQALDATVPAVRRTDRDGTVRVDLAHGQVRELVGE